MSFDARASYRMGFNVADSFQDNLARLEKNVAVKKVFLAADFFVPASRKILVRVGNTTVVSNEVIRRVLKKCRWRLPVSSIRGVGGLPMSPMQEIGDSPYHRSGSWRLPYHWSGEHIIAPTFPFFVKPLVKKGQNVPGRYSGEWQAS
jgi:hypothetical protein